jgi:hypothetical protein
MNNGIGLSFDIPAKRPGAYQVRVAARDRNSQKIGSAARFLTVPSLKNNTLAVSGLVLGGVDEFSSQAADAGDQAVTKPGSRRFAANSDLYFAYAIYNAANESGKLRNLVGEAKLFRDGKNVYSSPSAPINAGSQTDLNRLFANGVIRLAPDLEPGGYYLQVVITDKDAKKGQAPLVQWVDFEIEKR